MDFSESTKIVYNRIQKLEPENVSKIMMFLLLQDHGDREMIRLAFSPDILIHSCINKAKSALGLSPKPVVCSPISPPRINSPRVSDIPLQFTPFSPSSSRPFSSPANIRVASPYWDPQAPTEQPVHNSDFDDYRIQNQFQFLNLEDQLDSSSDYSSNHYFPERTSRRSPSLPEFPFKVCQYFNKGYCKHGNHCRYLHARPIQESFFSTNSNELLNDDHIFSPGSLEQLELELLELLKSRRGFPVSIASLPMLYYEKYGRTLQADGYLTESQRHGKAGYSLTKLLARLNNSIRLIDRPHGQHSVILAEDVPKCLDYHSERSEPGGIVAGSRQIYLTFPAESTFTEKDVSDYFDAFGPVQDVRIPCQQKRMFGFVTFVSQETVKQILIKGNPHFVCGARVLVKPYREKSRLVERKFSEKIHHPMYYGSHFLDMDSSDLHSIPRVCENTKLLRKQFIEEHAQALEHDRMRLSQMQFSPEHWTHHPYFANSMEGFDNLGHPEQAEFPSVEHFKHFLDVLDDGSTSSDDKLRHTTNNYNDQDSQGINLPESPFTSPMGSGISTAT